MAEEAYDAVYRWLDRAFGYATAARYAAWRAIQRSGLTVRQVARRLRQRESTIWRWLSESSKALLKRLSFIGTAIGCRVSVEMLPLALTPDARRT